MAPSRHRRLQGHLEELAEKLHGPLGIRADLVRRVLDGKSSVESLVRRTRDADLAPFATRAIGSGMLLHAAERFAVEQIELTVRASLDGGNMADQDLSRLYCGSRADACRCPVDEYCRRPERPDRHVVW